MKIPLLLLLISLAVLTAAKHEFMFVREHKPRQKSTDNNSGTNNNPSTTTQSSGWVQNPSGKASFRKYSNCKSPCKLSTYFHPCSSELTLTVTVSCSVRPKS